MNDRIQEIKDRLSAATEGEWSLEGKEIWRRGDGYGRFPWSHVFITDFNGENANNAELIVNAPEDIAYLLSEVERLQEGYEVLAQTPMTTHPSETRDFAKRMLKGETPYR